MYKPDITDDEIVAEHILGYMTSARHCITTLIPNVGINVMVCYTNLLATMIKSVIVCYIYVKEFLPILL